MVTGEAHGLFDCRASKGEIGSHLPRIRALSQIPHTVGLYLRDGMKELGKGLRYVMGATYPNATNELAGAELAAGLNQAYQSPLFEKEEPFRGRIVYERDGRYVDIP